MFKVMFSQIAAFGRSLSCSSVYETDVDYQWSVYLHNSNRVPALDPKRVKQAFADVVCAPVPRVRNHTHGKSAAARSSAVLLMDKMAADLGVNCVHFQGSGADKRNDRALSRTYFWGKDVLIEPHELEIGDRDIICMTDVDYYIDMPAFLNGHYNPILLYTFQPSQLAKDDGETTYTFDSNNYVHYHVSGGGYYTHKVWNYAGDCIGVPWVRFGQVYRYTVYALERRQIDPDHQLVLLVPLTRHRGLAALRACRQLQAPLLKRLELVVEQKKKRNFCCLGSTDDDSFLEPSRKFVRLATNDGKGCVMHTGITMGYATAKVPFSVDDELASIARASKAGITLPMVKSKMTASGAKNTAGCEILYEYHAAKMELDHARMNQVDVRVHKYQFVEELDEYIPDAKPSMIAFMDPILDGAYVPAITYTNEKRSIDSRVEAVKDSTKVGQFVMKVVKEFVREFTRGSTLLHPLDEDELLKRQNRPAQRRILDEAQNLDPVREVSSFMKRETYQNITDPRNISTINGTDKRSYSAYMYALSDYVKQFEWYAFGRTPYELSEIVADLCSRAETHVMETDFSRMDGRVGEVARFLERSLVLATFHHMYHDELNDLLRSQINLPGKTKLGVRYQSGLGRLSGSPETSVFNTILNAFTAFLTFRKMHIGGTGSFYTARQAWQSLGVYAGDDGLTPDADANTYVQAAHSVGQRLVCNVKSRGEPYVSFLARFYGPFVWNGDPNSCCDFARVLSKFHTTVSLPSNISNEDKLYDKAHALYLSDAFSPVVGDFVTVVHSWEPHNFVYRNYDRKFYGTDDRSVQYVNRPAEWMTALFVKQLPNFNLGKFDKWLSGIEKDLWGWINAGLKVPCFHDKIEPVLKTPGIVIVDDDIIINSADSLNNLSFAETEIYGKAPAKKSPAKKARRGGTEVPNDKGKRSHATLRHADVNTKRRGSNASTAGSSSSISSNSRPEKGHRTQSRPVKPNNKVDRKSHL